MYRVDESLGPEICVFIHAHTPKEKTELRTALQALKSLLESALDGSIDRLCYVSQPCGQTAKSAYQYLKQNH